MNGGRIDFIADTSAIIGLLRGDPRIEQQVSGKNFAITFITLAELSLGVLKSSKRDAAWTRIRNLIRDKTMFHVSTLTPAIYVRSRAAWHDDSNQRYLDRSVGHRSETSDSCAG